MEYLSHFLNQLYQDFHQRKFLASDPLEFVHRYSDPWDQEAVALLSAVLAYGNVKQIRKSVQSSLDRMATLAQSPRLFVQRQGEEKFRACSLEAFSGFVHRFNSGSDVVQLFGLLSQSWKTHGSLGNHFTSLLETNDTDIGPALSRLMKEWEDWHGPNPLESLGFLLTSPSDGSCCKRWCMLLRWMGRRDALDPGLWTSESPLITKAKKAKKLTPDLLIMPLDTHTARISQYLGLTERKTFGWKTAQEITQTLKSVDPSDPTRYDFALSRLGILDICRRSYRKEICKQCQLLPACKFAKKSSSGRL